MPRPARRSRTTPGRAAAAGPRTPAEAAHDGFSAPTREWIASAPLADRKRLGQYMTPRVLRERLLDRCDLRPGMRVLDPGAGTGEFLRSVLDREPDAEAYGWEVDGRLVSVARRVVPEAHLEVRSALSAGTNGRRGEEPFDLVIGNPPYFQFRADADLRKRFREVISGRVNIFALFFQIGLEALRPGGRLAFVAPPSMNAGAYFDGLRNYLLRRAEIEFLEIHEDAALFDRACTAVQLIVLRTGEPANPRSRYVARCDEPPPGFRRAIFSEDARAFARRRARGNSLYDLGYEAVTGTVVWNQHRDALRRRADETTVVLIWSHNIGETLRVSETHRKPQFIETTRRNRGPAIVVNRVLGAVGRGRLRCAAVPEGMEFVAENHVNVVRPHGRFAPRLPLDGVLAALRRETAAESARLITGNTQLSATELTHLLPL